MESLFSDAGKTKQFLSTAYFLFSLNITFQVMAITEMSPSHKDAVTSFFKCSNDKQRINSAGTHDTYGPDIGWVLQSRNTGQIGPGIGAPVA
jgi:hypothetical protein